MSFWVKVGATYLVLAIGLVISFGLDWRTGLELVILLLGFLPPIIRHVPRLYLLLARIKYFITNQETIWRLSLEFYGTFDNARVEEVVHEVMQEDPGQNSLLQSEGNVYVFRYRRTFTIEITLDDPGLGVPSAAGEPGQRLAVTVMDQRVSYRSSKRMIERTLVPFFEWLWNEFGAERGKYTMNVAFEGPNPFFGLYIQQMSLDRVREFTFVFTVPTANAGDYVRVEKGDMTVVSSTLEGFRQAAMTCLAFSAPARS